VMIEVRAWMSVLGQSKGPLMRGVNKGGVIGHDPLGPWAVWDTVKLYAKQIGLGSLSAHDLRRTCAKLCRKNGGELEQIQFLLGHQSIQTTERYLGSSQELQRAVNDNLGI
jgi:integrase